MPDNTREKTRIFDFEELGFDENYVVILYNGPQDVLYVLEVLMEIFNKNPNSARDIMLKAHYTGSSIIGHYGKEEAEQLVQQVNQKNASTGNTLRVEAVKE